MSPKGNDRFPLSFWLCALPFSRSFEPTNNLPGSAAAPGYKCTLLPPASASTICNMYFRLICRDKLTFAIIDKIASMLENADDCLRGGGRDVIRQIWWVWFSPTQKRSGARRHPSNNPINITCTLLPGYTLW